MTDTDPAIGIGAALVIVSPAVLTVTPAPGPIAAIEGNPLTNVPLATFTDNNPGSMPGDFIAVVNWGDGSPVSLGSVTAGGAPGTFLVTGNHTYVDEGGPFTITVIVTDNTGGKGTATLVANVADATLVNPTGIPVDGTAGHQISGAALGVFTDNNPLATASDFTATINWGDPSAPVPTRSGSSRWSAARPLRRYSASGAATSTRKAGTYSVTITVQDDGGQSTVIVTTATIIASQISGQANPVVATEGLPTPANLPVATFTDLGAGPATTFSVTVAWGDGTIDSNAPGGGVTVVNNGGGDYTVLAPPHTYADEGLYVLTVTISGSDGSGPIAPTNIAIVKDAAALGQQRRAVYGAGGLAADRHQRRAARDLHRRKPEGAAQRLHRHHQLGRRHHHRRRRYPAGRRGHRLQRARRPHLHPRRQLHHLGA